MGAIHKVDRNVLGPDSAAPTRSNSIVQLPANSDIESKRSKRLQVKERQSYVENLDIILWGLKDGFELCK